jgi:protein-L-isoaspartate(D-aspartate) O-methyltransferase
MADWNALRQMMVAEQLVPRHIRSERVLAAMARVPRHLFVPPAEQPRAYADMALPIAAGQTISQPYIVALMADSLELRGRERVLEIGTGSGYAAAILAECAAEVVTVERQPELIAAAARTLHELGYTTVRIIHSDGSTGWPELAPYDAISVPAGAPAVPPDLLDQLADGGRLVIPIGPAEEQHLIRMTRHGRDWRREELGAVRFVPLIGAAGWNDDPMV